MQVFSRRRSASWRLGIAWATSSLLVAEAAEAHVGIVEPAAASQFAAGQRITLKWQIVDHGDASFDIDFATDVGEPWSAVAKHLPKQGSGPFSYDWTLPNERCDYCRVRVSMTAAPGQHWEDQLQLSIGADEGRDAAVGGDSGAGCSSAGTPPIDGTFPLAVGLVLLSSWVKKRLRS